MLYHYLVGGQTSTVAPTTCAQEIQPSKCDQQSSRAVPLKHTVNQSIQTTDDQCIQTLADQGIQTMPAATQEAATSVENVMLLSHQNEVIFHCILTYSPHTLFLFLYIPLSSSPDSDLIASSLQKMNF